MMEERTVKKLYELSNSYSAFFGFVGFIVGILVFFNGLGFWSAFFTGMIIYIVLKFLLGVWSVFLKLLGAVGVRYDNRE